MPGGNNPPRDWNALRATWDSITTPITITEFAKQHGISREAVSRRMAADAKAGKPWRPPQAPEKPSNVVDFPGGRRASGRRRGGAEGERDAPHHGSSALVLLTPAEIERLLRTDGDPLADADRRARIATAAAEGVLLAVLSGRVAPGINQSLADVVDKAVAVMERATKLARLNAGKKDGERSADGEFGADGNTWEVERRIVGEASAAS